MENSAGVLRQRRIRRATASLRIQLLPDDLGERISMAAAECTPEIAESVPERQPGSQLGGELPR